MSKSLVENAQLATLSSDARIARDMANMPETTRTAEAAARVAYCMERHWGRTPEEARHAYHTTLARHLLRVPFGH